MKLGKQAPVVDPRVPHLSKHMCMALAAPSADWTKAVSRWTMLANDSHSCCTASAAYHMAQLWRANSSLDPWIPTDQDALTLYSETSDYPKQDDGAVEMTVLQFWAKNGIKTDIGTETIAFAALNPHDLNEVRLSVQNFGGAYIGLSLPISMQTQTVWDVPATGPVGDGAPGSYGGHAVCIVAYDQDTLTCVSWGQLYKMTNKFYQTYCDESYCICSEDWLADSGISPPGLNWEGLMQDMQQFRS